MSGLAKTEKKNIIKVYLAHYNSVFFFEKQVFLIRKFFKLNNNEEIQLYGFVDSSDKSMKILMKNKWLELDVIPIDLPSNRSTDPSASYGLAFQFIYDNYIIHDNYISVFLENDVFPIADINLKEISDGYGITTDIRFYTNYLPKKRICQAWLGLQIFNHKYFKDKDKYSGLKGIIKTSDGLTFPTDCGGQSYYWFNLNENWKNVKHINPIGQDINYNPFTAQICEVHNITNSIHLPGNFRQGYKPDFRVINYGNLFLHLESQLKNASDSEKTQWFFNVADILLSTP
jgi:hypothetical protein